ncbi:DUF559 domain-containing protein [Aeromicrobium sp. 636]|uniref:DUF559 domain-containing protein n=1 Tax=Aeromicrobium senzhongii TaxID=2663859 RepID=A0A8I0EV12_9ACTN|nr:MULTISPECIES: DUF559 domain-containing protein [Aeromicrobium]MBC9225590.1 DUF559 domain-containing protein [Aeromicrobium senzhongii]MCQ3997699.1 DUF559 domain-containing protein [Aeromicrobium sp. 636]
MARLADLPEEFTNAVFSRRQALAAGLTDRVLRGPRCAPVAPAWYRYATTDLTPELAARSGLGWLGAEAGLSHTSNLAWRGLEMRAVVPVHLATRRRVDRAADGFVVHRFQGPLFLEEVRGLPLVGAARTFVDCGTLLSWRELVVVGDWMISTGLIARLDLLAFVHDVHFDGVQRARRAMEWVRDGSASPQESRVRLELVRAGLPEPELNALITDRHGGFLAYGDLVYRAERLVVEYDGWQHERDARQRQHDLRRREVLEGEGWRVIVVTAADLENPTMVVNRLVAALQRARFAPISTFQRR